jgi:hypothetical protein
VLRKWSLCNKWTLEDQIVVLIAFNAKVIHMHIDQPQEILLFFYVHCLQMKRQGHKKVEEEQLFISHGTHVNSYRVLYHCDGGF